jgi:acetate kinase
MSAVIAVLNAGSSSFKFSLFALAPDGLAVLARGQAEGLYTSPRFVARDGGGAVVEDKAWEAGTQLGHAGALDHLVAYLRARLGEHRLVGVGHRVVHGGAEYSAPVRIDGGVLEALQKYAPLAPLHQPHNLTPIRALIERQPQLPQVACFDTAFHRRQPPVAQAYALPRSISERGVLRYGFHGLSYEYIAGVLPRHDERARPARSSSPTSATARACARSPPDAAWRARWASPPPTGCRWAPAAATSTRGSCSTCSTS